MDLPPIHKRPFSETFDHAEEALLTKKIRLAEAKTYLGNPTGEAHLVEALNRILPSLAPDQPLKNKTAWTLWPLVRSQDEKTRHLACRTLLQHHQDVKVSLADGEELLMSSVLLGVKHPVYFPHALRSIRKANETVDLTSISAEGLAALQRVWAGIPMANVIANEPQGKRLLQLIQAADFFGCDEVLEPKRLVEAIGGAYASTTQVTASWGERVILESSLSSKEEVEEVLHLGRLFSMAGLSSKHVFIADSPDFLTNLSLLLNGDEDQLVTDMTILKYVGDNGAAVLASLLENNRTLRQLNLSNNGISVKGSEALGSALAKNDTLEQLELWSNYIGNQGAIALATALKRNHTLQQLSLRDNSTRNRGTIALASALEENKSLKQLELWGNDMSEKGAKAIGAALGKNKTLKELNLTHNFRIGGEGIKAIGTGLENNHTLLKLSLSGSVIGDEETKSIGAALAKNHALQELHLSSGSISDEGGKAIGAALEQNHTLRQLDISRNSIGDEGAKALAKALETNSALEQLNLWKNSIETEGAIALATALTKNHTLRQLNLSWNDISDEGKALLTKIHGSDRIAIHGQ